MTDSNGGAPKRPLAVYAVIDRKDRVPYWMRLGAAFTNRDGSITFYLDAVPTGTHRLQIREQRPWDEPRRGANGQASAPDQLEMQP